MIAAASAAASQNSMNSNDNSTNNVTSGFRTAGNNNRQGETKDAVVPFENERMDNLESQVQRLGASLIEVNRKLDRLTSALLPKDINSDGNDSEAEAGPFTMLSSAPGFGSGKGGAFGNSIETLPQKSLGHFSASVSSMAVSQAGRKFANLKKKKKVVGFGQGVKSPAVTDSIEGSATKPESNDNTGLDMSEAGARPVEHRPPAGRRMSQSGLALNISEDLSPAESGAQIRTDTSVDSKANGDNQLAVVPGGGGDNTGNKPVSPAKGGKLPGTSAATAASFSALGTSVSEDKGFWEFEPLHTSGRLNTVADSIFIVVATVLSAMQISALHDKADEYFQERSFAPWWLVGACTVLEVATGAWMVMKSVTREGERGWMSDTTKMTRAKYVRTYLLLDLCYTLPLEICLISLPLACYWSMTRHWLRWFRIYTLRISDNPFALGRPMIVFIAFLGGIVMIHHIMAAIAWMAFSDEASTGGQPLTYLDSLYWAVSTTTSTGYGDISPKKESSRVVGMISMISGALIVASTTAFATSLLTQRDALEEEHDKKRKMMQSMLEHYQIPWNLRQHVITLFPHVLQTHSEAQFKGMMESLPPGLGNQLSQYVQAKMLVSVSVFKGLDNVSKLLPLVERLQQRFVNPQEVIVNQGDDSLEMYFLIFGTVQVIRTEGDEDIILSTLFSGTVFGEMGVIRGTKRAASIQAVTACELMVLTKEDFEESIQEEGLEELISSNLDNYTMPSQRSKSQNNEPRPGSAPNGDVTPKGFMLPNVGLSSESDANATPVEKMFHQHVVKLNGAAGGSAEQSGANSGDEGGQPPTRPEKDLKLMDYSASTAPPASVGSGGTIVRVPSNRTDKSTSSESNNPLAVRNPQGSPPDSALDAESFHAAPNRANTALPTHSVDTVNMDSD